MKKYKLIKTYPGYKDLGLVVSKNSYQEYYYGTFDNRTYIFEKTYVENNPEFWEEVSEYKEGDCVIASISNNLYIGYYKGINQYDSIELSKWKVFNNVDYPVSSSYHIGGSFNKIERLATKEEEELYFPKEVKKDYEILSFKHTCGSIFNKTYSIDKSRFSQTIGGCEYTEAEMLRDKTMSIYSIKRLSDNVIFTIGDTIRCPNNNTFKLSEIQVNNNLIELIGFDNDDIKNTVTNDINKGWFDKITRVEKLFTTEDGVDIYENQFFYILRPYGEYKIERIKSIKQGVYSYNPTLILCFSTKKAAEKHVLENKPIFSLNDLRKFRSTTTTYNNFEILKYFDPSTIDLLESEARIKLGFDK